MGLIQLWVVFLWAWERILGINYDKKNKNLLCFNTGGPCKKINRPLKFAHEGLGINDKES